MEGKLRQVGTVGRSQSRRLSLVLLVQAYESSEGSEAICRTGVETKSGHAGLDKIRLR